MSWGWTLLGTVGQMMLALVLFMLAAFSGGGLASGRALRRGQLRVLDGALFALPGVCGLSAIVVLFLQWAGGGAWAYAWHALPLAATVLYLAYVGRLARRH